jgi:hypothetical protein
MAIIFLLAEELIPNRQQQDCRLIVQIESPDEVDSQTLHHLAEGAIKARFGGKLTLKLITEQAASHFLQSDPGDNTGSIDMNPGVLVWRLVPPN